MNYIPTDDKSQENYSKYKDDIFKELTMNNFSVTRTMIIEKMHNKNLINHKFYKKKIESARNKDKIDEYNSMRFSFTISSSLYLSIILTIFGIYPILFNNLFIRVIYILYLLLLYVITIIYFCIRYPKDHED